MLSLDIPDPSNKDSVADWIELAVGYEAVPMSKAAVITKLQTALGDEPADDFISSVWDELENRMYLYGEHPPFVIDSMEVNPNLNWQDNPEYIMCLILALTGNPVNPTPTGKLFERISKEAIQNYIQGQAIVTGHPGQYNVQQICNLTYELFRNELPPQYNDRGVDVIAWKSFNDQRGNQILILMQCAGGHNWFTKTGDVKLRPWTEHYIGFHSPPVRGFSTAVVVPKSQFYNISLETDLLFDRTRIYRNVIDHQVEGTLRIEVLTWCNTRLLEILN